MMNQCKTGGQERKKSLWCSSCAFQNSLTVISQGGSTRFATGWFQHTRSTCRQRDQCPLASDDQLGQMSSAELREHVRELGVTGPEEQAKRKAEIQAASRASEARSVSVGEEPEKKRLKKEKKEEEKRKRAEAEEIKRAEEDRLKEEKAEEDRVKKEAEEFKESLGEKQQKSCMATCLTVAIAVTQTRWNSKRSMKRNFRVNC